MANDGMPPNMAAFFIPIFKSKKAGQISAGRKEGYKCLMILNYG
jgi:hypothetical protein